MRLVLFVHVVAIALWFGSAAADLILELVLRRTRSSEGQRVLIDLHRTVDVAIEGPAVVVAMASGAVLLDHAGLLSGTPWPVWLQWKVGCGAAAAVANLACVAFVVARSRSASLARDAVAPGALPAVRRWSTAVALTGLLIPCALTALWLGVTHAG